MVVFACAREKGYKLFKYVFVSASLVRLGVVERDSDPFPYSCFCGGGGPTAALAMVADIFALRAEEYAVDEIFVFSIVEEGNADTIFFSSSSSSSSSLFLAATLFDCTCLCL